MNLTVYRKSSNVLRALCTAMVIGGFLAACGPRLQRVSDDGLVGVPNSEMNALHEARKELALARADLQKARDAATEAGYRLKLVKAALEVAEARRKHGDVLFDFANWKKDSKGIIEGGEEQRAARESIARNELELSLAKAKVDLADTQVTEAEAKVFWLDAEQELEKARLAHEFGKAGTMDKQAYLQPFEQGALKAKLDFSDATGKRVNAQTAVKRAEDKLRIWETGKR